jgi:DeoR/GlpR family transcriptional regulator of sugar metabolism
MKMHALTTTTTHETFPFPGSAAAETLKRLRFDIAAISIDMMKSGMVADVNRSKFIDIGPLCDLVESALEEFGI